MQSVNIILDGDGCWPDLLKPDSYINAMGNDTKISVAPLRGGMTSGRTSITFRIDPADGKPIVFEMSLAMLKLVVQAIESRYYE